MEMIKGLKFVKKLDPTTRACNHYLKERGFYNNGPLPILRNTLFVVR